MYETTASIKNRRALCELQFYWSKAESVRIKFWNLAWNFYHFEIFVYYKLHRNGILKRRISKTKHGGDYKSVIGLISFQKVIRNLIIYLWVSIELVFLLFSVILSLWPQTVHILIHTQHVVRNIGDTKRRIKIIWKRKRRHINREYSIYIFIAYSQKWHKSPHYISVSIKFYYLFPTFTPSGIEMRSIISFFPLSLFFPSLYRWDGCLSSMCFSFFKQISILWPSEINSSVIMKKETKNRNGIKRNNLYDRINIILLSSDKYHLACNWRWKGFSGRKLKPKFTCLYFCLFDRFKYNHIVETKLWCLWMCTSIGRGTEKNQITMTNKIENLLLQWTK